MGCIVTKELGNKHFEVSVPKIEFEPVANGKKKRIDAEHITRQYNVITDPLVTSQYFVKNRIGFGTFSDVFMVVNKKTKLPYAIKHLTLRSLKTQMVFQSEENVIKLLKRIGSAHPFLVHVEDILTANHSAYIVMELCTGGDLHDKIQQLDHIEEKESARITAMIVSAVQYLHSINITHRDLKPENVLFYTPGPDSKIVITDFGLASTDTSTLHTYCGTLQYCSPELILGNTYSSKIDTWAIGVMTYLMLSGRYPFTGCGVSLNDSIVKDQHSYERQIWNGISERAKDFVNCLLTKSESQRCNATQALSHDWLKDVLNNTKVKLRHHRKKNRERLTRATRSLLSNTASTRSSKRQVEFDNLPVLESDDNVNNDQHMRRHSECAHVNKTKIYSVLPLIQTPVSTHDSRRRRLSEDCLSKRKTPLTDMRDDSKKMFSDRTQFHLSKVNETSGTQMTIPLEFSNRIITIKDILDDTSSSASWMTPTENDETNMVIEEITPSKVSPTLVTSTTQLPPLFRRSQSYSPLLYNTHPTESMPTAQKHSSLQSLRENAFNDTLNEQAMDSEKLDNLFRRSSQLNMVTPLNGQYNNNRHVPYPHTKYSRTGKVHDASITRLQNPVSNRSLFRNRNASSNVDLMSKSL